MSASIAIQVLPNVEVENKLVNIVDKVIEYIKNTGVKYEVGPFETTLESDSYDELMEIAKNCQYVAAKAGANSVYAYIKVAFKADGKVLSIDDKVSKHRK